MSDLLAIGLTVGSAGCIAGGYLLWHWEMLAARFHARRRRGFIHPPGGDR